MKFTITLHPVSLAVGAAALGGMLWLASVVQAPTSHVGAGQVPVTLGAPIEVKGIPTPGQMVRLTDGQFPYTVPSNRTFVITGCIPRDPNQWVNADLQFDGQQIAYLFVEATIGGSNGQATITPGIVATSGQTVDLKVHGSAGYPTNAVLLGYLSN